jgi:Flp pilus assembly protein TadG
MMRDSFRRRSSEEGAVAVETALVLTTLLLLIFGIIEFGTAFWTYNTMVLAIEEAGRYAMVYNPGNYPGGPTAASCPDVATITLANCTVARANNVLSDYARSSVSVSCTAGCTGTPATMTIQGTYAVSFVTPNLLPYGTINLQSQLTVPLI